MDSAGLEVMMDATTLPDLLGSDGLAAQGLTRHGLCVTPTTFKQRGSAINSKKSWGNMLYELDGRFCDASGCATTDRIYTKGVTTDPGAATSRANASIIYSPNNGHFGGAHFQSWVYVGSLNETDGGYVNTMSVKNGSLTWYIPSDGSLRGEYIWHPHTFWALFYPTNSWYHDDAKTGKAECHTSDNVCPY